MLVARVAFHQRLQGGGAITMATANANAAPGATRPVDQHVEFVVKVSLRYSFPAPLGRVGGIYGGLFFLVDLVFFLHVVGVSLPALLSLPSRRCSRGQGGRDAQGCRQR